MAFVEVYQMVLNFLSVSHLTLGWTSLFLNSVVINRVSLLHLLQLLYTINHINPALYRPSMGPNLDEFVSSVDAWHGLEWTHWFHLTPFICTHWPTHNKWLLSVKRAMLLKLPMLWILTQQRKTPLSKVKHCEAWMRGVDELCQALSSVGGHPKCPSENKFSLQYFCCWHILLPSQTSALDTEWTSTLVSLTMAMMFAGLDHRKFLLGLLHL